MDNKKQKKLEELVKDLEETKNYISGNYAPLDPSVIDGEKKLIMCQHELVFTIKAQVLEENESGEHIGTKQVCIKNYHIPVPANKDYNVYMSAFFEFLESCLSKSAQNCKELPNVE